MLWKNVLLKYKCKFGAFNRVGHGRYYVDDDCCGHYQNFRDVQLAARAHHRYESFANTGPPPPYHRRRTYLAPMPECRCCPTPRRDLYYDQYTVDDVYDGHRYGPAPPIPARTPLLSAHRQTSHVEGRRPITSPTRPRSKTPFSVVEDRHGWPGKDRCYSVFDDPRRAEFETAANGPTAARPGGSCVMRRRADTMGFTDNGRAASLGHI